MKHLCSYNGVTQNSCPTSVHGRKYGASYKAQIARGGRTWYLGTYKSMDAAAYVYDAAARRLEPWSDRGTKLNFPAEFEPASKLAALELRDYQAHIDDALAYLRASFPGREEAARLQATCVAPQEGVDLLLSRLDSSEAEHKNSAKVMASLKHHIIQELRRFEDALKEAKVLSDFYKAQVSERDAKIEALESKLDLKEHAASIPEVLTFKPIKKALPTSASFES